MFDGYQNLPLPPPWRRVYFETAAHSGSVQSSQPHYMNEITKDVTSVHPFSRFILQNELERQKSKERSLLKEHYLYEQKDSLNDVRIDELDLDIDDDMNRTESFLSRPETATTDITDTNRTDRSRTSPYSEFKCLWKELGLFGDRSVFGLSIRYSIQDERTLVRFDGIDGEWEYSVLEGPYGPVTRHDLFVGAKVKVFGRSLAITTASRESCQWIEKEYKKMSQQQESMRLRIEKCGNIPIVQRAYVPPVTIFTRDGPGTAGRCDLRRTFNENARLGEQLVKIGLAPRALLV